MLKGKNAVVTGSRRGIGRAVVECLASYGANIWAHARKEDIEFEKDMAELAEKYGVWIKPVYFDLADDNQIKAGVKSILGEKLAVDILVNNAGITGKYATLQMTSLTQIKDIMQTNLIAPLEIIQMVSRNMSKNKKGSIINIGSIAGLESAAGYGAYGASKAGIHSITKTLSEELAPMGIRVNALAPGAVDTDMFDALDIEASENTVNGNVLKRLGTPMEIAQTVAFLAGDNSSFITGQIIRVDGGM